MNLLNFYIPEWFFVALNLLILVLILKRLFWKPVGKILEERQAKAAETARDAEEAARLRDEAERLRVELDAGMEARTAELMQEARQRAGREYDRIVADAEQKAQLILSAAERRAERERERVMVELRKQISDAALEAAGLLLRANIDGEKNNRLVESVLSRGDVSA